MENWSKQTGTTEASIIHRTKEVKEKISGVDDTIKIKDSLVKENIKFIIFVAQNFQDIWDNIKRPNLKIIRIEEGELI